MPERDKQWVGEPSEFRVTWVIDLMAHSYREAAEKAKEIQQDLDSTANVFNVQPKDQGLELEIDLDDEPQGGMAHGFHG